jgi:hypothetical protein
MTGYPEVETDGRVGATTIWPRETETGSAGTQPCRGITLGVRIGPLKIPARRAEYSQTESAPSFHLRLNQHTFRIELPCYWPRCARAVRSVVFEIRITPT